MASKGSNSAGACPNARTIAGYEPVRRIRADGPRRARVNRRRSAGRVSGVEKSRDRRRATIRDQCANPPTHQTDSCRAINAASADAIAASRARSLASGSSRLFSALTAVKKPSPGRAANSGPTASVGSERCSPGTDTSTSISATSMPVCDANRKASTIESPGTNGTTMPIVDPRPRSKAATGVGQQLTAHSSAGRNDAGSSSATTPGRVEANCS